MGKPIASSEDFISRLRRVFGDAYSYDLVEYVSYEDHVTIVCEKHGAFEKRPKLLLGGTGCPDCGKESRLNARLKLMQQKLDSGEKLCPKCGIVKPLEKFSKSKDKALGRVSHCKKCSRKKAKELWADGSIRDSVYKRKFGITLADYDAMYEAQDGKCAICKTTELTGHGAKHGRFSVDHDHTTGEVRGLLCHQCNVGLGSFKDDVEIMANAIKYLENTK